MEVEHNNSEKIERPGKEDLNVKYADNTGKKAETAKSNTRPRRRFRRFKNTLGRRNYTGNKTTTNQSRRSGNYSNENRRQRGLRPRRRGVKILVRNLTRNASNSDIKYLFEKIGPLKRCGINWNNLAEAKLRTAEATSNKPAPTASRLTVRIRTPVSDTTNKKPRMDNFIYLLKRLLAINLK